MFIAVLLSTLSVVSAGTMGAYASANTTYLAWTSSDSLSTNWDSVTNDRYSGKKLVATDAKFNVYTSSDFGLTFTKQSNSPSLGIYALTSDGTGQYVAAGTQTSGVYVSTNAGVSWTLTSVPANGDFYALGSGLKAGASNWTIVAVGLSSAVYKSTNTGATWTDISPVTHTTGASYGSGLGCSITGQVLQVTYTEPGKGTTLYVSTNFGSTWTASTTSYTLAEIAASKESGQFLISGGNGVIYISSNYGMTWVSATVPVAGLYYSLPVMSGNGKLAAIVGGGVKIFFSENYGQTWTETNAPASTYEAIATNMDGDHWTTAIDGGKILVGKLVRK